MTDTTVSRATLVRVAESFRELMLLRDAEQVTMAQMIRWCVGKLRDANVRQSFPDLRAKTKLNEERDLALLYLDHLATRMEGRAPQPAPLTGVPATLE